MSQTSPSPQPFLERLSTGRRKFVPGLCPSQGFAPCIRYGMHLRQPVLREERETISTGRLASDFLKSDIETAPASMAISSTVRSVVASKR